MCGAFFPDGSQVLVTAGHTIETMMMVESDGNSVSSALLGTVDDVVAPWALEAALISVTCFKSHAEFLCHSRLKQCKDRALNTT